jgi:hypothetical protein
MIFIKVIKNVFDNLRYDLRNTKYEVEIREKKKKEERIQKIEYRFWGFIFYIWEIEKKKMKYLDKYWNYYIVTFVIFMFVKPALSFLILGLLIFLKSIDYFIFLKNIKKNGIYTEGKIISYEADSDGHKQPYIEYKTKKGEVFKEKPFYYASTDLSIFKTYNDKINQIILIIYDKNIPNRIIMESETNFNNFSLIFMFLIGFLFCLISVLSLLGYIEINL